MILVLIKGFLCGFSQPHDLRMGYTFSRSEENEAFDRAVNFGGWFGRVWFEIKEGPKAY